MTKFTLDKEYINEVIQDTELTLGEDVVLDTREVYLFKGTTFIDREIVNHPRFDNFRFRLERMGYIDTGEPDIINKDFSVNGFLFLEDEIFPTAEQFSNRYVF